MLMFVCTVAPGNPLPLNILRGNEEFIVRIPVGFDDDTGAVYSAFVAFSPLAGHADIPGYECVFSVIEASHDQEHVRNCWDGLETQPLIPKPEDRTMVLNAICMAISVLIDEANAGIVSMTTHSPDLPKKALRKFNRICTVFSDKGYEAGKSDSYHGRHIWMMQRSVRGTVDD